MEGVRASGMASSQSILKSRRPGRVRKEKEQRKANEKVCSSRRFSCQAVAAQYIHVFDGRGCVRADFAPRVALSRVVS